MSTKWEPGQSGNPSGRPKVVAEIRDLARKHTPEAFRELVRLSTEAESEAARVTAIKEILDRGYGKAPQVLSGEGGEGDPVINVITGVSRNG